MPQLNTICSRRLLAVMGATLISALFACAQQTTSPMTQMDTNKDQQVTKEEYMKYQEKKFEAADKNKDKSLNQEEWFQHQLEMGD